MAKIDLKDLTFTIPVRYDTDHRIENLKFVIEYLRHHFDTNIIILEEANEKQFDWVDAKYKFIKTEDPCLHRTRCLNLMAKMADTPYIANYDTDVIFPVIQYVASMKDLRSGKSDGIYPYGGRFLETPRKYLKILQENGYNTDIINLKDCSTNHPESLGGAVLWNKRKFIEMGMENENFKSWGWEDNERYSRAKKLGIRVRRVSGPLFHISHKRLEDSKPNNRHYKKNEQEFQKVRAMKKEQLKKYVKEWDWVK